MRTTAEEVARSLEPQTLESLRGDYEFSDMGGFTLNVTRARTSWSRQGPVKQRKRCCP